MNRLTLLILLTLIKCQDQPANTDVANKATHNTVNYVKVQVLESGVFYYDVLSNGKLVSEYKSDLNFTLSEYIKTIYVKNGDRVRKGQLIAEQDQAKVAMQLQQAGVQLDQAKLELQNVLIGQAYTLDDTAKIPPEVMKIARTRSGYNKALIDYQVAQHSYTSASLHAPFDGIVANLSSSIGSSPKSSEPFCTILDNARLEADFMILEQELAFIRVNDKVEVETFTGNNSIKTTGYVHTINPTVNKNGLVNLRAKIANTQTGLFDGMNIRVKIRKQLGQQMIVPKSALVLRDNKQVVFSLKNGLAQWNYITVTMENSDTYVIDLGKESSLKEHDTLIIDGNINLAHQTPVEIE